MASSGRSRKSGLSHIDPHGRARMVDVSAKVSSRRKAAAEAVIRLSHATLALISERRLPKGDAVEIARLAGIMAAKRTADLIPLCHPLLLTRVDVSAEMLADGVRFVASVACHGPTGAEMEALTSASVAALTLYDMVKAVERDAVIEQVRLLEKSGGASGTYRRSA